MVDYSFLTPESQGYLSVAPGVTDFTHITAEMLRSAPSNPFSDDIPRPQVTVERIQIPTIITDDHPINVDVFRPKNAPADANLPVLVYLPGGGWTVPAQQAHPYLATKLAGDSNCVVLLVHYSLSPEVKFPVALEECYSVVSYVTNPETAAKLNIDPTRVALGGDSAGGNLTAAVTLFAKQRNDLKNSIKYQILYYPVTDRDFESESYNLYGEGHFLTRAFMKFFYDQYTTEEAIGSILFTPNLATTEELSGLPPALLVVAEADVLRSDGESYGRKLLKAGVSVTSIRVHGVIHGFMSIAELHSKETRSVINMTTAALRDIYTL